MATAWQIAGDRGQSHTGNVHKPTDPAGSLNPEAELPSSLAGLLATFRRHLAAGRGLSPHTVRAYASDAGLLLGHVARCGIDEVADIDVAVIRAWLATQHAAGHSRATIARRAAAARALTAFAYQTGSLAADPGALLGTLKARRELPQVLSVQEMLAVLGSQPRGPAGTSPRARHDRVPADRVPADRVPGDRVPGDVAVAIGLRDTAIMELLYATGIRVSELCGLDLDDVDHGRRTVRVLGKGAKERVVPFGLPAGRAVDRWSRQGRGLAVRDASGPALLLGARGGRL